MRAQAERYDLDADDHQQRAGDHGVQIPLAAEDLDLAEDERGDDGAEATENRSRHDEQVRGRVDQQEAQVSPAVAEARELRLTATRVVLDRELPDVHPL